MDGIAKDLMSTLTPEASYLSAYIQLSEEPNNGIKTLRSVRHMTSRRESNHG